MQIEDITIDSTVQYSDSVILMGCSDGNLPLLPLIFLLPPTPCYLHPYTHPTTLIFLPPPFTIYPHPLITTNPSTPTLHPLPPGVIRASHVFPHHTLEPLGDHGGEGVEGMCLLHDGSELVTVGQDSKVSVLK